MTKKKLAALATATAGLSLLTGSAAASLIGTISPGTVDAYNGLPNLDNTEIPFAFGAIIPAGQTWKLETIAFGGTNSSQVFDPSDGSALNNFLVDIKAAIYDRVPGSVTPGASAVWKEWWPFDDADPNSDGYFTVDLVTGVYTALPPASDGTNAPINPLDVSGLGALVDNTDVFTLVFYDDFLDQFNPLQSQFNDLTVSFYGTCQTGCGSQPPDPTPTPTPASLALLGIGLAGLGAARKRRHA